MLYLQFLLDLWDYLPKLPYAGSLYMDLLQYLKYMFVGVIVSYSHRFLKLKLTRAMEMRQRQNYPPIRLNMQGEFP